MFGLENYQDLLTDHEADRLAEILDTKYGGYWINEIDGEFEGIYEEEEII